MKTVKKVYFYIIFLREHLLQILDKVMSKSRNTLILVFFTCSPVFVVQSFLKSEYPAIYSAGLGTNAAIL